MFVLEIQALGTNSYFNRIIAGVQMLQKFCNDLSLGATVFPPHGAVHQLDYSPVEMRYEVVQIFPVGVWIQTFPTDPLHCISGRRNK